jgi:hypothetical protein
MLVTQDPKRTWADLTNGRPVVERPLYLLTNPLQLDILGCGPGWRLGCHSNN